MLNPLKYVYFFVDLYLKSKRLLINTIVLPYYRI